MTTKVTALQIEHLAELVQETQNYFQQVEPLVSNLEETQNYFQQVEPLVSNLEETQLYFAQTEVFVDNNVFSQIDSLLAEMIWTEQPVVVLCREHIDLKIQNQVTPTNKYVPLTGVHTVEAPLTGWIWDRRLVEDRNLLRTRYDTFLGGQEYGLKDGTILTDWQSGVVNNIDWIGTKHYRLLDSATWTPQFSIGMYSLFYDTRPLYSDYGYVESFNPDRVQNGVMTIALRSDSLHETISVAMYTRTSTFLIFKYKEFLYQDVFTGELDTGTNIRLATEDDSGNILWGNLTSRKREYIIRNDEVVLNQNCRLTIGSTDLDEISQIGGSCFGDGFENKGPGNAKGRNLFTDYFPVENGTVKVFGVNGAGGVTEWSETANLNFSGPTEQVFAVDYDLGIITMGGYQAPDLILAEELEDFDTEVVVYLDAESIDSYPSQGILTIGTEKILYYGKTRDRFIDCVRGYDSTTAAIYAVGTVVSDTRHGAGTTDNMFIGYTAVPRIEYEVTEHTVRSANKYGWLDVRASRNVITNNVVQILSADIDLAEILLETSSPLIGGNIYGPVLYGTDYSKLTATALDSRGNPVGDIELTIQIVSGPGGLNGEASEVTDISNSLGQIYAFYNAPYDKSSIEKVVTSVTYDGANTTFEIDGFNESVMPSDIWVFQVFKHDQVLGTIGNALTIRATAAAVAPYGLSAIHVDGILSDDVVGGVVYIQNSLGVRYLREVTKVFLVDLPDTTPGTAVYLSAALPAGTIVGEPAYFIDEQAREFNSTLLNGVRVILYEWTELATHPITKLTGAYSPVHPESVSGTTMTFNNRTLPLPDRFDHTNNLAAYTVIAPSTVVVQAYGKDPISGRIIRSNRIRLQLNLPTTLNGVDTSGVLPIPHGFTFVTDEFNIGGALGGANFITINPRASGINQFSIAGLIP